MLAGRSDASLKERAKAMQVCLGIKDERVHLDNLKDEAGEKVYAPLTWQSLKSRMAVDCTTTSVTKAPSCCA